MEAPSLYEGRRENQAKEGVAAALSSCTDGTDISNKISLQVNGNGREWNLLSCLCFTVL